MIWNGETKYTFWQTTNKRARDIGWRVDYVVVPNEFCCTTLRTQQHIKGSDHCPIISVNYML